MLFILAFINEYLPKFPYICKPIKILINKLFSLIILIDRQVFFVYNKLLSCNLEIKQIRLLTGKL